VRLYVREYENQSEKTPHQPRFYHELHLEERRGKRQRSIAKTAIKNEMKNANIRTGHATKVLKGVFIAACALLISVPLSAQRRMEYLDRGMVGVKTSHNSVFISWRLRATDHECEAFHLYRQYEGAEKTRLTDEPLRKGTNFENTQVDLTQDVNYTVVSLQNEQENLEAELNLAQHSPVRPYLEIPLRTSTGYTPGDASVGDLDGDGAYEIIIVQTGKGHDNAHNGITSDPIFQAYKLDGTCRWEINLGKNIREGAHYTQFMVYDLDGDGCAELICKTADGTKDGVGRVIGDAHADWRDTDSSSSTYGRILEGPEYLTVFDGRTGAAVSTVDYLPERGDLRSWGDTRANRSERYLPAIAYLDGTNTSLVMTRGYYERATLAAWDFKDGDLVSRWVFDTKTGKHPYAGQGYHSLAVADVDEDGKDEIIFGAMSIDDDGTGLYTTGLGHGDALHVTDLEPDRPGLEAFGIHELKGGRKG